jgi:hypothetical protein
VIPTPSFPTPPPTPIPSGSSGSRWAISPQNAVTIGAASAGVGVLSLALFVVVCRRKRGSGSGNGESYLGLSGSSAAQLIRQGEATLDRPLFGSPFADSSAFTQGGVGSTSLGDRGGVGGGSSLAQKQGGLTILEGNRGIFGSGSAGSASLALHEAHDQL